MAKKKFTSPHQTKSGHKIALYVRVSTQEQAENPEGSIRNQEERLRQTIALKNMDGNFGEVTEVFIDRAKSGKDTNRPELQRMLNAIQRREFTLVMVSELSRLSRSIKDFSGIWEMMQTAGCGFLSLRENFDTTTAAGEMVLYTVANIAQFERRQISERVSANMQVRASRGLYNGGSVPIGYVLIPDKPGFLAVEPTQAEIVRLVFSTFLREGSLNAAARWLNANGIQIAKLKQGGGDHARSGHFSISSVQEILKNRAYIGVKRFQKNGITHETKSVWEPIVDQAVFEKAQEILLANHSRYKPSSYKVHPYLLTRLTFCGGCGHVMNGKSAHGRTEKVAYYEHGWLTKQKGCLLKPAMDCFPYRLGAKKIEPLVWEKVWELIQNPALAKPILESAKKKYNEASGQGELKQSEEKVKNYVNQIDALVQRLSQLPKEFPADAIFKQVDRLEALKREELSTLESLKQSKGGHKEPPADFDTYKDLLRVLHLNARKREDVLQTRMEIIKRLVHKIEILPDGYRMHFKVGRDSIEGELASAGSLALQNKKGNVPFAMHHSRSFISGTRGSHTLTNGWSDWG